MLRGTDRKAYTMVWIRDCGPLEVCYFGLAEDGSERRSPFCLDAVERETASKGAGRVHVKGR